MSLRRHRRPSGFSCLRRLLPPVALLPLQVRSLLDFTIYLDISDEIKFAWKIQRDMAERGWTLEQVQPLSTDSSLPLPYQPTPHRHFPINRLDLGAGTTLFNKPLTAASHRPRHPSNPFQPCPTLSEPY